jgi:hypothetical protein
MPRTWYLYEDKARVRWWSDWPPPYMPQFKFLAYMDAPIKPTDTRANQARYV